MKKGQAFQQVMLRKLDSYLQINEITTLSHTIYKNKLKIVYFKHLNIRHDTIKLLEENTGKAFSEINRSNVFLDQSPKAKEIKAKINKWDLIKLKIFCTAKETINKTKGQPME